MSPMEIRCRRTTVGEILRVYRPEYYWMFIEGHTALSNREKAIDLGGRYLFFMPEVGEPLEDVLVKYLYPPDADVREDYLFIQSLDPQAYGSDCGENFELLEIHPDGEIVVSVQKGEDGVMRVVEVRDA